MGQGQSQTNINWQSDAAKKYMPFLIDLFGMPYAAVNKPHGLAVWRQQNLANKTLFGQPVCFKKIIAVDENVPHNDTKPPHYDFLYGFISVPITIDQQQSFIQMSDAIGYDQFKGLLWARCQSIDGVIVLLKLCTDVALGNTSAQAIIAQGTIGQMLSSLTVPAVKQNYLALCDNISKLTKERFIDDPWYAVGNGDPYSSNQPLDISLVEQDDAAYYKTIDNYMNSKNVSKCADAYPRAPTGKATTENFFNMGEIKKKKELMAVKKSPKCVGACAKRYNQLSHGTPQQENLISFNAYKGYYKKPGSKQENLISFNAYKKYYKKPQSESWIPDFLKKKNT